MLGKKIKLRKELHAKLVEAAEVLHCSSVEEFIEGVLEREADRVLAEQRAGGQPPLSEKEVDSIKDKLKGLGYIE